MGHIFGHNVVCTKDLESVKIAYVKKISNLLKLAKKCTNHEDMYEILKDTEGIVRRELWEYDEVPTEEFASIDVFRKDAKEKISRIKHE